jgi:hypothetical protein
MGSATLERWIKHLGGTYDSLVAQGIIPDLPLQELYEDSDSLEIEPVEGIELGFWIKTKNLELIRVCLADDPDGIPPFTGELPAPFDNARRQELVHQLFGRPMFSKGALELAGTGLGGWETYQLSAEYHSAALLDFFYDQDQQVSSMTFSLIEKHI